MRLILTAGALAACVERPAPPAAPTPEPVAAAPTPGPASVPAPGPTPTLTTAVAEPSRPVAADPVRTPPPTRSVRIAADPPPPFTYWAPEGATIRNHGNPGIWIAYVQGRQVGMYFGDDCGASGLQHWVGMPVDRLPAPVEGEQRRTHAVNDPVTEDLRPNRLNVAYDPRTRRVERVSCG